MREVYGDVGDGVVDEEGNATASAVGMIFTDEGVVGDGWEDGGFG